VKSCSVIGMNCRFDLIGQYRACHPSTCIDEQLPNVQFSIGIIFFDFSMLPNCNSKLCGGPSESMCFKVSHPSHLPQARFSVDLRDKCLCKTVRRCFGNKRAKAVCKIIPLKIKPKNLSPFDASDDYMVQGTRRIYSCLSWHASAIARLGSYRKHNIIGVPIISPLLD
jgi:hypothetical protein